MNRSETQASKHARIEQRMAAVNERLEVESLREKLVQSQDRLEDVERRSLHLERELRFYDEAIAAEAQIQARLKLQNRQTEQQLRDLQDRSADLRQTARHHEKKQALAREEAQASLETFTRLTEDLQLALEKLKSMEALAKQLTEENYRLGLEQADESRTASTVLRQSG